MSTCDCKGGQATIASLLVIVVLLTHIVWVYPKTGKSGFFPLSVLSGHVLCPQTTSQLQRTSSLIYC